jgi:hypothetical protein
MAHTSSSTYINGLPSVMPAWIAGIQVSRTRPETADGKTLHASENDITLLGSEPQ